MSSGKAIVELLSPTYSTTLKLRTVSAGTNIDKEMIKDYISERLGLQGDDIDKTITVTPYMVGNPARNNNWWKEEYWLTDKQHLYGEKAYQKRVLGEWGELVQEKIKKENKMATYGDFSNDMLEIRVDEVNNGWQIWIDNDDDNPDNEYIASDPSGIALCIEAIISKRNAERVRGAKIKELEAKRRGLEAKQNEIYAVNQKEINSINKDIKDLG